MTGDTLHEGHIHVLKVARSRCDMLMIGLTTDEVAKQQKRIPIENYKSREAVISSLRFVDAVLPHNGEPKSEAWRRLRFDICFTCAEEYLDSVEFIELRENCPQVEIIGVPRYPQVSSSRMLLDATDRFLQSMSILTTGIAGPIYHKDERVWKTIHFARKDLYHPTRDNYGFFNEYTCLPRNYKHEKKDDFKFPFIAGINPGREFAINHHFKDKPWSVFEYGVNEPKYNCFTKEEHNDHVSTKRTLSEFADYMKYERKFPPKTGIIVMHFGGITLKEFLEKQPDLNEHILKQIIIQILKIIEEIKSDGVLHGDIHASNILVHEIKENTFKISIIDWGWCSAHFFDLSETERKWLSARLDENWDKLHFLGSLYNYFPQVQSFFPAIFTE